MERFVKRACRDPNCSGGEHAYLDRMAVMMRGIHHEFRKLDTLRRVYEDRDELKRELRKAQAHNQALADALRRLMISHHGLECNEDSFCREARKALAGVDHE